jgi:hypothetical protein
MAMIGRELGGTGRAPHAVRRLRTADRFWRHNEFAGDLLLALLGLYVLYLLLAMVVVTP